MLENTKEYEENEGIEAIDISNGFNLQLERVFSIDDEIPSKKLSMLALTSKEASAKIKKGSIL